MTETKTEREAAKERAAEIENQKKAASIPPEIAERIAREAEEKRRAAA